MKWCDYLSILRVRAVEETDTEGRVLDAGTRQAASREMIGEFDVAKFLVGRASLLSSKIKQQTIPALEVPGWIKWAGWIAAFTIGWWLAVLGQEREINLLALPLIVILAWNTVIISLSLFHGLQHRMANAAPQWMEKFMVRVMGGRKPEVESPAAILFHHLAWPVLLRRMSFRLRSWLHMGAALLALGSAGGMYARGWSREYRAVWESTLLNDHATRVFFNAVFAPASRITGFVIPLDQLRDMRRRSDMPAKKSGEALPWIHLYAATLGLFVILPRVMLAWLEQNRAGRVTAQSLRSADWLNYLGNLRVSVEGDGAPACVLVHGLVIDDAARDRWRRLAYSKWRDVGPVECHSIPIGEEAEFVAAWEPTASRLMVVFNLSVTPELEVQRALVESLLAKTSTALLVALDDAEMKKRSAGFSDAAQRLSARANSWKQMMEGLSVTWI